MKFHISVTKKPGGWMGMILETMNVEEHAYPVERLGNGVFGRMMMIM